MNRRGFMKFISAVAAGPLAFLPKPAKAAEPVMGVDMASGESQTVEMTFASTSNDNTMNVAYYACYDNRVERIHLTPVTADEVFLT